MLDPIKITEVEVSQFSEMIEATEIDSKETLDYFGSVASRLKALVKDLEENRKRITAPMNEALREVNARYSGPRESAQALIEKINQKMGQYLDRVEAERKRLQRIADEERAAQVREAVSLLASQDSLLAEEAMDVIATPGVVVEAPKAPAGVGIAMRWTWECVDFSRVPDEFKVLDEGKLNKTASGSKGSARIDGIVFKQVRRYHG